MDEATRQKLIEEVVAIDEVSAWAGSRQLDMAHKAGMNTYTILGRASREAASQGANRAKLNAIKDAERQAQDLYQRIGKIIMMD